MLLQTLSVTAGALISRAVPDRAIAMGAGLLFLGFAVWTWRSANEDEDDDEGSATRVTTYLTHPRWGDLRDDVAVCVDELAVVFGASVRVLEVFDG